VGKPQFIIGEHPARTLDHFFCANCPLFVRYKKIRMTLLSSHGEPLQNPYELLGLERGAADDDINKAFKKLMLKLHPDKQPAGQSEEEAAEVAQTFHNVMAAKSFLLDTEHMTAKRAYDSKLASLDRQKQSKFISPVDKNTQSSGRTSSKENSTQGNGGWRSKRRGSDCTDDRGPNLFNKTGQDKKRRGSDCTDDRRPTLFKKSERNRRASVDDCSTTSQSSSGDDNPAASRNKGNHSPSRRPEKERHEKTRQRGTRHTYNGKSSTHNRSGSNIPKVKKSNTFSESCSSFFTEKVTDKNESKSDKKDRRSTVINKRSSANGKSEKSSAPPQPSSPNLHSEAKQRITDTIDAVTKKFRCPLTKDLISDPVTDFEGNSYEREAILKHLNSHSTSPVTGAPLYPSDLTPNAALKDKIRCTLELKRTLDTLGEAQKKELKHVTKQHGQHTSSTAKAAPKPLAKNLRESINSFITDLQSGSPNIAMSSLDNNGTSSFSYLDIKFKLEVSEVNSYSIQTLFDHNKKAANISIRLVEWNKGLQEMGLGGKLTFRNTKGTFVFSFDKKIEPENFKSRTFRYSVEYFLEFAIKLHNIINVTDLKTVGKVRLSA